MKIVVTGANGQIGWELSRSLLPIAEVFSLDRMECDLSSPKSIAAVFESIRPDVIVNAAAYTSVDKAEAEQDLAKSINGAAVELIAHEARRLNALLIHYSTDYVFDGNKNSPYTETDVPNPVNAYGRSKLQGDLSIQEVNPEHLILRTSWVYSSLGNNFLKTILRLSGERDELSIVDDQKGSPTLARNIADATAHIIRQSVDDRASGNFLSGIYNLVSEGETTWYGFAQAIIQEAESRGILSKHNSPVVSPISSETLGLLARRPANSCLSTEKIIKRFGIRLPDWRKALTYCPFPPNVR